MGQCFLIKQGYLSNINETLPSQLTNFTATADRSVPSITVSWENPSEYWKGTMIIRKEGSVPTGISDGIQVYKGTDTSFVDTNVEYDVEYYYRAYPYNDYDQYQTAYLEIDAFCKGKLELSYYGTATALSVARRNLSAASTGNYALFGGGFNSSSRAVSAVDAYDSSLTRTIPTALSVARHELAATSVGNYALFGGGSDGNSDSDIVDVYQVS